MRHPMMLLPLLLACSGCAHDQEGVRVVTKEVVVEVMRPCEVEAPAMPEPLGPLPSNAPDALRIVAAKLLEYAGPGGALERYRDALAICTKAQN